MTFYSAGESHKILVIFIIKGRQYGESEVYRCYGVVVDRCHTEEAAAAAVAADADVDAGGGGTVSSASLLPTPTRFPTRVYLASL